MLLFKILLCFDTFLNSIGDFIITVGLLTANGFRKNLDLSISLLFGLVTLFNVFVKRVLLCISGFLSLLLLNLSIFQILFDGVHLFQRCVQLVTVELLETSKSSEVFVEIVRLGFVLLELQLQLSIRESTGKLGRRSSHIKSTLSGLISYEFVC